jgi:hypothetical protein
MPRKAINFSNTIFYKIVCKNLNITELYVGHTTNFRQRKNTHKSRCKNVKSKNYNTHVYKFIRENGGWENWNIIIIHRQSCIDVNDAKTVERWYIESLSATLNCNIPSTYIQSYRTGNKDDAFEYNKNYYAVNKENILESQKKYYQLNKEKIIETVKIYAGNNKEKKTDYYKEYYLKNKELKKENQNKYREANKEKIKETQKKYREENKEKIREYKKIYKEASKEKNSKDL